MLHIGISTPSQLLAFLQRIETYKKTGRLTVSYNNIAQEIYAYHGRIIAVTSPREHEPLIRRLVHANLVSLEDLQNVPTNIGGVLNQLSQNVESYSDVKIAKIVMKLGLVHHEQLLDWIEQETTSALQQLLAQPIDNAYFEEDVQPPTGHLGTLLIEPPTLPHQSDKNGLLTKDGIVPSVLFALSTPLPPILEDVQTSLEAEQFVPETPHPFQAEPFYTGLKAEMPIVPLTPSGFVRLPKVIEATQTNVQRAVSALLSFPLPNYPLTARVATPPRPNPLFRWETLLIIAVLLIAGLAHGINMFHYPYYEDDEGTYLSQAWAVFHMGRLAYYTYWYDHAPAGWIQIAIWAVITGGFHTFGSAIDSGRIFMLLLQLGSTFILYRIARILSTSTLIAIVVSLLFALSPYGLYYHRRILLDNIMTFWMLLSILPLISSKLSLKHIWFSAISLAIAILSKEVAVFIIPSLAYLVWIRTDKIHRTVAFIGWLTIVFVILSAYPLLATLKGELFPTGTLLGGSNPHVSLIGTVLYQGSRGKDAGLFSLKSMFWYRFLIWVQDDPILVVGGSIGAILTSLLIFIKKHRLVGIMGLTTLLLWAFIARGGVVLDFYLIPLIPMLALSLGLTLGIVTKYLQDKTNIFTNKNVVLDRIIQPAVIILCLVSTIIALPPPSSGVGYGASNVGSKDDPFIYWNGTQANAQVEAIAWIEQHVSKKSRIIIDMYMWPDLYSKGYHYVHYYWKLEADPAINGGIFHNNWRNIDYIVTTPQMLLDMQNADMKMVKSLIENSSSSATFDTGKWNIDIRQVHK